jgi:hypothetical protein
MASDRERKPFLLRLQPATMAALKAWAAEDLRSLNGQIEYVLRAALRDTGRLPRASRPSRASHGGEAEQADAGDGGSDRAGPSEVRGGARRRADARRNRVSCRGLAR